MLPQPIKDALWSTLRPLFSWLQFNLEQHKVEPKLNTCISKLPSCFNRLNGSCLPMLATACQTILYYPHRVGICYQSATEKMFLQSVISLNVHSLRVFKGIMYLPAPR